MTAQDTRPTCSKTETHNYHYAHKHKLPSPASHNKLNLHLLCSFNSLSNKLRPLKHQTLKKPFWKYCLSNQTWNYTYIFITQYYLRTPFNPHTHIMSTSALVIFVIITIIFFVCSSSLHMYILFVYLLSSKPYYCYIKLLALLQYTRHAIIPSICCILTCYIIFACLTFYISSHILWKPCYFYKIISPEYRAVTNGGGWEAGVSQCFEKKRKEMQRLLPCDFRKTEV